MPKKEAGDPTQPQPSLPVTTLGYGTILVRRSSGERVLSLGHGEIVIQGTGPSTAMAQVLSEQADVILRDSQGSKNTVHLDGDHARVTLAMGDGSIVLDAEKQEITVGQPGKAGLVMKNGAQGALVLGGSGREGQLLLFRPDATSPGPANTATAHLAGNDGYLRLGGNGGSGLLVLYASSAYPSDVTDLGRANIHLDGESGNIVLRRIVDPGSEVARWWTDTIVLDAKAGDIVLTNADCAEDFEVVDFEAATPGTVMVLDDAGHLCCCTQAYDSKVAGIVSGAGHLKPGIVLGRDSVVGRSRPIALSGRVNCQVDAEYWPVKAGDLLTTSSTPGHAMKVLDERRAFGCVIGKALAALDAGRGLLPILVALQ